MATRANRHRNRLCKGLGGAYLFVPRTVNRRCASSTRLLSISCVTTSWYSSFAFWRSFSFVSYSPAARIRAFSLVFVSHSEAKLEILGRLVVFLECVALINLAEVERRAAHLVARRILAQELLQQFFRPVEVFVRPFVLEFSACV